MTQVFRIGIAGLGTVGASAVLMLDRRARSLSAGSGREVRVTAVSARDRARDRGFDIDRFTWFDDPVALAASPEIDCFIELIGGEKGTAKAAVEAALKAGKHVVTANKALLARHGSELAALAEAKGVSLQFEAAVAGGVPIVKTLREAMAGNAITRISGILNGTCNYILSRMEAEGLSFDVCLGEAQRLGYAEADPTFDIGGFDSAHKLAILTSLAFGAAVDADAIHVEGISAISPIDIRMAQELGYRIKLLGVAEATATGIEQRVHPTMVPLTSAIAQVMGVTNAVTIAADAVREITLIGPGAGGDATASAVVADIADIARGSGGMPFVLPVAQLRKAERAPMQLHHGGYYVRLTVNDRPGAAASIVGRFAEADISLESIVQHRSEDAATRDPTGRSGAPVPVVLITYATTEAAVRQAIDKVVGDGYVVETPQIIRIERE
ncbi:homoserine dehydrogenase [Chelatococcus asaccharovorans]|uniref:Homoserine dehydrogenase n=1 Tax=Chelatococcus asaccharovorans TaxID=28210 RepID=A0A2V3U5K3_9HYPH|nr:homoserine dehydrogenase [Chelatococcus asaccharovorans]MBS7702867.1 homoserine dehydrogenase [Chelatococcus asaccharovorans]PXW57166.1 homoserine dehydrogenase [Chelatococcus asaccharovorans]